MRIPPYVHSPVYADGKIPRVFARENPWAWSTQRGFERVSHSRIESLTSLEQDLKFIIPGLKARLSFSFDRFAANSVVRAKTPDYFSTATARDANGKLIISNTYHGEQYGLR